MRREIAKVAQLDREFVQSLGADFGEEISRQTALARQIRAISDGFDYQSIFETAFECTAATHRAVAEQVESIRNQFDYSDVVGPAFARSVADHQALARQIEETTKSIDYSDLLTTAFDASDHQALARQIEETTKSIDYTDFLRGASDATASMVASIASDLPEDFVAQLVDEVDLQSLLEDLDWDDQIEELIGCLAGSDDEAEVEQPAHQADPAAPLILAAMVLVLLVGPTVLAIAGTVAFETTRLANDTLKAADHLDSVPQFDGAANLAFAAAIVRFAAEIARRLLRSLGGAGDR